MITEHEKLNDKSKAMGRRTFIGGTMAATLAATALGQTRDYGQGAAPVRYPDRDIIVLDPRFAKYKLGNTAIQRLHTGMLWAEGPAWNGVGRYLVWSDIPNNMQHRWLAEDGHVSVSETRQTTATATRLIGRAANFPVNMGRAEWFVTNIMAR